MIKPAPAPYRDSPEHSDTKLDGLDTDVCIEEEKNQKPNTKLHVNQDQVIPESPVFEKILKSKLKEKDVELEGKDIKTFVDFLRCTLPGFDEEVTDKTVHLVVPLAEKYQTAKTLQKADKFVVEKSRLMRDAISSQQIITNILQAELYHRTMYLEKSIAIASRNWFKKLVTNPKLNGISSDSNMKIAFKRWSEVDQVFESSGYFKKNHKKWCFYQPYLQEIKFWVKYRKTLNLNDELEPFMQTN
ncbi:Hypothetical predicted protein [Mytilus galloprovincialis]|uniref:Uncharacterized protein n=1 Tax=Mytilus galloprovincialis TaxID=29158 RepID=A0A8B6FRM8_MYTGA|nr:Hypothetical predicted protein [Mytilus galloprovincialis]